MTSILESLGGIGLFLFGMAAMSSGLRKLAGARLRGWLSKSTQNPVAGVLTGAGATAVLQSSSATTVAAVGLVGAGLLTFSQALGIIFGANIGTTATGWIVAVLGFKLKLATVALPLLFVSSLFYLFKRTRFLRGLGKAVSGFCLIFIGISTLQSGLEGYRDLIDLSGWTADHLGSRMLLLMIGVVLTLITQSSSATVATALTALNMDVLTLPQAAAVIIGADIGTTGTAALATLGGTASARRTGIAHVIYNLLTGITAFFILFPYLWFWEAVSPGLSERSPEVLAAGFHTFFNLLGVILVLPLTQPFARLMLRIVPEESEDFAAQFNRQLLAEPSTASAALTSGCRQLASEAVLAAADSVLERPRRDISMERIDSGLNRAREFAVEIGRRADEGEIETEMLLSNLHLIDHVERLSARTKTQLELSRERFANGLEADLRRLTGLMIALSGSIHSGEEIAARLEACVYDFRERKCSFRKELINLAAEGGLAAEELDESLDAQRWLRRVADHCWRIAVHALPT